MTFSWSGQKKDVILQAFCRRMATNQPLNMDLGALLAGRNEFDYTLDDAFFQALDQDVILGGDVKAVVCVLAHEDTFQLHLDLQGEVSVTCDRCLDPVSEPVKAEDDLLIKLAAHDDEDDDCLYVDMTHPILDLGWLFYEEISVNLPIVCRHQPGECNPQMEELLQAHLCKTIDDETEQE